jgi:hypoxanthine phosphoribosyltransferase
MFMSDLARHVKSPLIFDFMDVSSYEGTESSGVVRVIKDLEENIEGRNVLIVEDIVDTGLTLRHVVDFLKTRNPASMRICTLLDKPDRRTEKQIDVDYNGFEIPDKFVVGYGLDYDEKYRNIPFICVLKPDVYE